MKKNLLLFFLSLLFIITKAQLGGTYTIDPKGDYPDIASACTDLIKQGVKGSTTFVISSGTYKEEISLTGPIQGVDAKNPITFISNTNQARDVIIYGNGPTVTLSDVECINFRYLTLGDTKVSERTIVFEETNSNINFYGCVINTNPNGDKDIHCGVYANSTTLSNIIFKKNTFNGGYSNLYFDDACGGEKNMSSKTSIVIDSNILNEAYHSGIYVSTYTYVPSVSYNEITTRAKVPDKQFALYLTGYSTFDEIIGNKIHLMGDDVFGIHCSMENNSYVNTDETKIFNNVIVKTTDGNAYGIFHEACKVKFYNNTIYFNNGKSDSYGIEIAKVSEKHMFRASNNIIICMNSGKFSYPISSTTAAGVTAASGCYLDYNNYYSSAGSIASIGGVTVTDMDDLRTATGQDQHSLSKLPYFYDFPKSLKIYGFDFTGPILPDLTTDIDGLKREKPTTWGAYQFVPFTSVDMQVDALVSPSETVYKGVKELASVRVLNAGTSTITSGRLYWSFNGVDQPSVNWKGGNLTTGSSTVINLDSITPISGVNKIKIYSALSGDTINFNDTIEAYLFGCDSMLSGKYTVGKGKDFESLTDLYLQLHYCGIKGPVTLLLDPGKYGNVEITETFPGSSKQNTITLTSATGDSTDVIFSSTTNAIVLQNTAHLVLHKVTIDATNGEVGILFAGGGENIEISNCLIRAKTTSTSTYQGVSQVNGTTPLTNVRFLNNNIQGGYYGIYLSGNNNTDRNTDIIINGNIINSMNYGIYGYQTVFNYANNNVITQDLSSTAAYYGMYFSSGSAKQIVGNKIRADKKTQHGINFNAFAGTSTDRLLVANNELILTGTNAAVYGIYITSTGSAEYTDIYHNSMLMKGSIGTASTTRASCLYLIKQGNNLNIKNNNFVNTLTSYSQNANTLALWISNATYLVASTVLDYNNYYTSGNNLMRNGTTHYTTLNAWTQATSKDSNSMNILPNFKNTSYGDLHTDGNSIVCPILTEVPHDIENTMRADSLTNMGCYHDMLPLEIEMQSFVSPIDVEEKCVNDNMIVEVKLANAGRDIDMRVDTLSVHLRINGAISHQQDTIITTGTLNHLQTLNVQFANTIPLLDTGMCYISVYISQIDNNATNDTLRSSIHVIKIEDTYDTVTVCNSELPYTYGDSVFTTAGNYNIHYTSMKGCDSLIKLTLYVNPTYEYYDTVTICDNELLTYGDSVFVKEGDYDVYFSSEYGCDSIIKLTLYVNPTYEYYDTVTICDSELPFMYADSVFAVAGDYDVYLSTVYGCDSLIRLSLYVNPTYEYYDTVTICDSELPYNYGDSVFTTEGEYQIPYLAHNGCDSIIKLTLYVNPTYEYYDTITICDSELPYNYADSVLTVAGDYTIVFTSEFGCDSTVFLSLSIVEIPALPVKIYGETAIQTAGTYMYYVDPVEEATSYAWTVSNSNWTGSSTTDTLMVYIPDAGTATISVKAVNGCGESDETNLDIASSVSILDKGDVTWTLGQNIPNPSVNQTRIPFNVPIAGEVKFELTTINGQVLYREKIQARTGSNSFDLSTESLVNGIYYYSMEYQGQRIVKKMTIQK